MKARHGMNRNYLVWITLLLLGLGTVSASAMEDGGGRSVFATGAGNRAMAMGGAFAAVANDASAVIYNPAGLGLIQRSEIQATQTQLFGMGFSEQYASLVLPHWKLGTASLTWRNFGVDGIEERDDRGFLLSDDLEDRETELALGYGHNLLDGNLSLGGAFKVQRHSLAGYSGSGFGLDLGFWTRPLALAGNESGFGRGLALGLSLRNVIEPEIKLQLDAVPDPSALRAGLAWSGEVAKDVQVLGAMDYENTSGMEGRLHAGAEIRLFRILALRAGSAAGNMTAGAGLDYRGLGADYQYEENPLGDIHRFGLSVRFGKTVEESRLAYLATTEADIQARLDSAFNQRTQAQEDQLVADTHQALNLQRWDEALNMIGTLRVLAPDRPDLDVMTAEAYSGLAQQQEIQGDLVGASLSWRRALAVAPGHSEASAGLARVEAESDLRSARTRDIKSRYEAALDAFAQDDLITARAGFADVLKLSPQDQDAATMLERTEAAMTRRATSLGEECVSLAEAGQLNTARKRLDSALQLDSGAPGLATAASELARLEKLAAQPDITDQPAVAVSTPVVEPTLTPQRRREIDDLYRRGLKAMEERRRDEAVRYWEMVWSVDPDHEKVREYLGQEYLARGMEAYADGSLRLAVTSWEDALRVDPQDQRARGYLDRARQQLSRMEQISSNN
jgi:tetratricopeptide (TPR) repeat protein